MRGRLGEKRERITIRKPEYDTSPQAHSPAHTRSQQFTLRDVMRYIPSMQLTLFTLKIPRLFIAIIISLLAQTIRYEIPVKSARIYVSK